MTESPFYNFAVDLAQESAELILKHWCRGGLNVSLKADRTVVTETDREVELRMRERIKATYPDHGIIGEEYGNDRADAEYVWILDPIDGTVSYVHGIPLFGCLFGLLHHGQPILGVIQQPILDQLCIGDGTMTTLNGLPLHCGSKTELSEAVLLCTDPRRPHVHQDGPAFDRLIRKVHTYRGWGDCYGYLMVASGRADVMLDPVMSPWDLLPLVPILRGAGAVITDWAGNDPVKGASAIAASPAIHAAVLQELHG